MDSEVAQFLSKTNWNPRKGLESSLKACQDKLLDMFGLLSKIFEMAEGAKASGQPIDPQELSSWIQRAICMSGTINSSLAVDRRKAIIFQIDTKLSNLAVTEVVTEADGLLFGKSFVKKMGQFASTFTAIEKAQAAMRKAFPSWVSGRASKSRGCLSAPTSLPRGEEHSRILSPEDPGVSDRPEAPRRPYGKPLLPPESFPPPSRGKGRLRHFFMFAQITSDPRVFQSVLSFHIEVLSPPIQRSLPPPPSPF